MQQIEEERWYALKVFYNRVFDVERHLAREGLRSYIPLRTVERTFGGKTVRRREPAVSSLMFVRGESNRILSLQEKLRGVCPMMVYFDRDAKRPAPIPEREMKIFMLVTSADTPELEYFAEEPTDIRKGDRVRVTGGMFEGAEGYIRRVRGNRRLIVSIEGIVAVATAYIPNCFLEKIG